MRAIEVGLNGLGIVDVLDHERRDVGSLCHWVHSSRVEHIFQDGLLLVSQMSGEDNRGISPYPNKLTIVFYPIAQVLSILFSYFLYENDSHKSKENNISF